MTETVWQTASVIGIFALVAIVQGYKERVANERMVRERILKEHLCMEQIFTERIDNHD